MAFADQHLAAQNTQYEPNTVRVLTNRCVLSVGTARAKSQSERTLPHPASDCPVPPGHLAHRWQHWGSDRWGRSRHGRANRRPGAEPTPSSGRRSAPSRSSGRSDAVDNRPRKNGWCRRRLLVSDDALVSPRSPLIHDYLNIPLL